LDATTLQQRHPRAYQILFGLPLSKEQLWPARLPVEHRRLLEPFVDKRFVPAPLAAHAEWQTNAIPLAQTPQ